MVYLPNKEYKFSDYDLKIRIFEISIRFVEKLLTIAHLDFLNDLIYKDNLNFRLNLPITHCWSVYT